MAFSLRLRLSWVSERTISAYSFTMGKLPHGADIRQVSLSPNVFGPVWINILFTYVYTRLKWNGGLTNHEKIH
jgi:hypothetical protein